jgi:thiol:disulfide interchange protein DsbD
MLNIIVWLTTLVTHVPTGQDPVQWKFTSAKISANAFEIHLKANIMPGWHIFSTVQPPDAIPEPTTVQFSSNSEFIFKGGMKELGKLIHIEDSVTGLSANQYEHLVDLVQIVQTKQSRHSVIKGFIQFQICNESQCFPPKKVNFVIDLK